MFKFKKEEDLIKKIESAPDYKVNPNVGLSNKQVEERILDKLTNKTKKTVTKSYFRIIYENLFSLLNIILIVIATIMIVFKLELSKFVFLVVLIINVSMSLFQDIKARILVSRLALLNDPKATVIRNKKQIEIPFNEIVLGDVIVIRQGNTIPCDGVLIDGSIKVNESILTGEIEAVFKDIDSKLYGESVVLSGVGKMKVTKIGSANYASTIMSQARKFARPKSEILSSLTKIIRITATTSIVLGLAQVLIYVLKQGVSGGQIVFTKDVIEPITASMIAMIPNGMYLMTSLALSVGVITLSKHKILVRELYSIEMLARVNVLCVDKTGTLTDGTMNIERIISVGADDKDVKEAIGKLLYVTQDDNLTAKAIKETIDPIKVTGVLVSMPFESEKKYSAACYEGETVVMGAVGFFHITNLEEIEDRINKLEEEGKRLLLVAQSTKMIDGETLPDDLRVTGIIVINEHVKDGIKENIKWFMENDVDIKIISGDSALSLKAIAKKVGLKSGANAISLNGLTEDEVRKAAHEYSIFARVLPEQKRIIVDELRNQGNTVAMIGDGVNDMLALKAADCSIGMAKGADSIKSICHLVSLDSNFNSLPKVVEEGRRVVNNLQRVCSLFLVKNVFAMITSFLFMIFTLINSKYMYPFTTNNLILWELLSIGLAPLLIAVEPNRNRIKSGFLANISVNIFPGVLAQLTITFVTLIIFEWVPMFQHNDTSLVVIMISVMSLVILAVICMPLNRYRMLVVIGVGALMGIALLLDSLLYMNFNYSILKISYLSIDKYTWLLGLGIFVAVVPLYFLATKYAVNIREKFRIKKKNEKTGAN